MLTNMIVFWVEYWVGSGGGGARGGRMGVGRSLPIEKEQVFFTFLSVGFSCSFICRVSMQNIIRQYSPKLYNRYIMQIVLYVYHVPDIHESGKTREIYVWRNSQTIIIIENSVSKSKCNGIMIYRNIYNILRLLVLQNVYRAPPNSKIY